MARTKINLTIKRINNYKNLRIHDNIKDSNNRSFVSQLVQLKKQYDSIMENVYLNKKHTLWKMKQRHSSMNLTFEDSPHMRR